MTTNSRDLYQAFGKLMQNRYFMMAVVHQHDFMGHGGPSGSRGQMRLLQLLMDSPAGLTNAEIAEILDIRPSSVSATINRLEEAGLVERIPSETDKRAVIVRLSEKGRQMTDSRDQGIDMLTDKLFGCLTADEQAELQRLLDKLSDNAADIDWQEMRKMGHQSGWPNHHGGFGGRWF